MSLQDKNRAPGADEAFKKVKSAYECLNDDQKRAHYDRWGQDSDAPPERGMGGAGNGRHAGADFFGGRGNEFTAEEFFNHFFFGGQAPQPRRRRQYQPFYQDNGQAHSEQNQHVPQQTQPGLMGQFGNLIFLLPLLFVLLTSFLGAPATDDPFSLSRSAAFPIERMTSHGGVPYFVAARFAHQYGRDPRALYQVEGKVESQYLGKINAECTFGFFFDSVCFLFYFHFN